MSMDPVFLSHYVSISDGIPWSHKVYARIHLAILDPEPFLGFLWSCNMYPRTHLTILDLKPFHGLLKCAHGLLRCIHGHVLQFWIQKQVKDKNTGSVDT